MQKAHDPNEVRTMKEWEEELQTMFHDYSPNKKITREEAHNLRLSNQATDVEHEARKEFLKANGYEVTRENMMDITLNTVEKPEDDSSQ